jgi:hypothetical protein
LIDTGVTVKDVPGAAAKIITPEEVIAQMGIPDWLKPAANFLITKELIDTVCAMFGIQTNANGGYIRGAGTGTSDDIPAMLSNGEYVIRANAVKTIGVNTLDKLNQADRLGFAAGGMVNSFKKKKPKPLTRFCQICRGFSHQTIDCWYQEKNSHRRPMTWTMEQAAIEDAMIESADPLPIWAGQQGQGSVDVDEEEWCEEDVEKGTKEGTEGTAD